MGVATIVTVNAFYYPEPAPLSAESMKGYLKAAVSNNARAHHRKQWNPHPYYPLFFMPFGGKGKEYLLQEDSALVAQDVTPLDWIYSWKKLEMRPLTFPAREQPRLEAIVSRLRSNLPDIVKHAKPLKKVKLVCRQRFLGQFPLPLREGIDEKVMYGTIDREKLVLKVYENEFNRVGECETCSLPPTSKVALGFTKSSY